MTEVSFIGKHNGNLTPEQVLNLMLEDKDDLGMIVVLGYTKEGDRIRLSSAMRKNEVLWLLEKSKLDLLTGD
jgi:hypothetical protein